jgi:hypothetical protein
MALTAYQQKTQFLLHDPNATYFSLADITTAINIARGQIAMEGQCIRLLLSGGTITALSTNSAGTGYSGTITITISGSGQQATATAPLSGAGVGTTTLVNGGWGYITGTTTTVTAAGSGGGTNATFTTTIDNSLTTVPGQEVYKFSTANTLAQTQTLVPGVQSVIGVLSVACAWGANAAMKPILQPMIWSEFQAYYRSYNNGMQNYPTVWSQYAQGVNGSIYLWPYPSQYSQMDWDCYCIPVDLVDDTTAEAIPYGWTDTVPYYAAYLCYLDAQRSDDAANMLKQYTMFMKRARSFSETPFVPDYYSSDV